MITILIPAFNEERAVGAVIAGIPSEIAGQRTAVVVIDDGSTDATAAEASHSGADVIRLDTNHGKGAAMRSGRAHAAASAATWSLPSMPMDNTTRPACPTSLLPSRPAPTTWSSGAAISPTRAAAPHHTIDTWSEASPALPELRTQDGPDRPVFGPARLQPPGPRRDASHRPGLSERTGVALREPPSTAGGCARSRSPGSIRRTHPRWGPAAAS